MKQTYIDLMDKVFCAYSDERIKKYIDAVKKNGIEEHGFPRLAANLGILIARGRRAHMKDTFLEMMDICCREIPTAKDRNGLSVGNDFSVKEIVLCILEIEKSGVFDKSITDRWREELAKIDPYKTYTVIAEKPPKPVNNWAAFGAASEQVRKFAKIGEESDFIENQIASQIFSFDENGMYRDPNEPIVYDMVTRLQLCIALYFGYNGKSKAKLEENILKSADCTLLMQSVTGEIPYGGRSNQFLHNETMYAALCEFYAQYMKSRGDLEKAGSFKRAARLATESIIPMLSEKVIHHIKNYYNVDGMYGCEKYAYFDKYMVTTGSWLFMAYIMADNDIEEAECPAETGAFIFETSPYFHKVIVKNGEYLVQYDTNADTHYDSSGIGRIHKKGAPSAICLSVPFAKEPAYKTEKENGSNFSISGGVKTEEGCGCGYDGQIEYKIVKNLIEDGRAEAEFKCIANDKYTFYQGCRIEENSVFVYVRGEGEVKLDFPVFEFDGEKNTEISEHEKEVAVRYKGYECKFESDNEIENRNIMYENRNGRYRAFSVKGKDEVCIKISINQLEE